MRRPCRHQLGHDCDHTADGASGSEDEQQDAADAEAIDETRGGHVCPADPLGPIHSRRRREIILPAQAEVPDQRPIRAETRATLVRAIALGRRWLDELSAGSIPNPAAIASREGCSQRHVERTISLAFLAPDLVKAAIEGRLPRGVGVSRLIDLPSEWPRNGRCSACSNRLGRRRAGLPSSPGSGSALQPTGDGLRLSWPVLYFDEGKSDPRGSVCRTARNLPPRTGMTRAGDCSAVHPCRDASWSLETAVPRFSTS